MNTFILLSVIGYLVNILVCNRVTITSMGIKGAFQKCQTFHKCTKHTFFKSPDSFRKCIHIIFSKLKTSMKIIKMIIL